MSVFLVAVLYLPDFTSLKVDVRGCHGKARLMRKVPVLFLLVQVIISEQLAVTIGYS